MRAELRHIAPGHCVCASASALLISYFFMSNFPPFIAKEKRTIVQIYCYGSDLFRLFFPRVFCRSKPNDVQDFVTNTHTHEHTRTNHSPGNPQRKETHTTNLSFLWSKTAFFAASLVAERERPTRWKVTESGRLSEINDVK